MEEINKDIKVLWLASWYPSEYEHTNGDFVQRHALAVSKFIKLDVIHVAQAGKDLFTEAGSVIRSIGRLTEYNHSFYHKPIKPDLANKLIYNFRYLLFYKKILNAYIKQNGKPSIVHVHAPMKAGILALWLKKKYGIPFIVTEHSSMYDKAASDNFYKRSNYFIRNTSKVFKEADKVTCVSNTIGQLIKNIFILNAVTVIHNVVQTNLFHPVFPIANNNEPFIWIHVSSMYKLKNVEGIIEAFVRLNDTNINWQLRLIGPKKDSLIKLVSDTGLTDKVTFVGELSYEGVAKEMVKANALVMFSKHENFPCVIAEALCCGVPVLASDVGGIHEAINIDNGLLVPSENIEVLAHSLNVIMKNYAVFDRKDIAEKAKLSYCEETIGKQFISLYK